VAAAAAEVMGEVAAAAAEGTPAGAWAAAAGDTLADAWVAAAVQFMAAAEGTLAVAVVAAVRPTMGAEVAAAVAVAWACGSAEAAAGAVEATEPAGKGTRFCSTGSTSASSSRSLRGGRSAPSRSTTVPRSSSRSIATVQLPRLILTLRRGLVDRLCCETSYSHPHDRVCK
jgi:hypothetical protein